MDLKSCSNCGRIHARGYRCNAGKVYSKTDDDKLRNRYCWAKKSKQIKRDAMNLCEYCKALGLYTYDDLEVHHITKLRDDPTKLLEDENLICLCQYHHRQADKGEIDPEYLRELVQKRIEG